MPSETDLKPRLLDLNSVIDAELASDCLAFWGASSQFELMCGECSEFAALMGQRCQGRLTAEWMVDELADVLFMASQVANLVPREMLLEALRQKPSRTRQKLEQHTSGGRA